jgi:predicted metal-dependent HD superfamily phosphohydrolase
LDADLSILGKDSEVYFDYTKKSGRNIPSIPICFINREKKVLKHFLEQKDIFKTPIFKEKYEDIARKNIQMEIDGL